ncbi:uncharacterized protein LOC142557453 isoform X3 [Dermacentor variabilis]|uniref:uncharacterized protein LOC142557453 isoform X3 n=1 Tax=Dermacentor variabilis TaxID=34621 RepID=UPI003F5C9265
MPTDCDTDSQSLYNLRGTVSCVMNGYGFITVEHPRRSVFVHRSTILNPRPNDMKNLGLKENDRVILDAEVSPVKFKVRYQAIRVRRLESENEAAASPMSVSMPCADSNMKLENEVGTISCVSRDGGSLKFGPRDVLSAVFDRSCIPGTLLKPSEKVSDIFSVGDKVCFHARAIKDGTAFQVTSLTTVRREESSEVFVFGQTPTGYAASSVKKEVTCTSYWGNADECSNWRGIAPANECSSVNKGLVNQLILVPFTSDPRAPFQRPWSTIENGASAMHSAWQQLSKDTKIPASANVLPGPISANSSRYSQVFHTDVAPTMSVPAVKNSDTEKKEAFPAESNLVDCGRKISTMEHSAPVSQGNGPKDKPIFLPASYDNRSEKPECTLDDGHFSKESWEHNVPVPTSRRPAPASTDRPPYTITSERTTGQGFHFDTTFVSNGEKQWATRVSDGLPTTAADERQATVAVPKKGNVSDKPDAVALEKLGLDSGCVSHNSSNSSGPPPWAPTDTRLSSPGCCVSVHSNTKAVVERVQERSARVRFGLQGISNSIDVMAVCLYKNGRNITGDLRCALSEGDEIMLDYMIGSTGYELLIHCNAAWQGQKPQGVPYATPEEFREVLYAYRASDEGSLPSADWRSTDRNCPRSVESYKATVDPEQLPLQAAEAPGTAAGACHEDRQALDEVTLRRLAAHMKNAVESQIHQVMQRVKLESLRRFGIPEEAIGVSSDRNGPSVESYKTIVDLKKPPLQAVEAPGTAAGAGHKDEEALEKEIMDRITTQLWKEIPEVIHNVLQAIRLKFLVQWGLLQKTTAVNYSGYYSG